MFYNKYFIKQELSQWRNTCLFAKTVVASLSNLEKNNIHSCARHIVLTKFRVSYGMYKHINYTI